MFTQDKSDYVSNSKVYRKMGPGKSVHYKGVFTNQGCSLSLTMRGFTVLQKAGSESMKTCTCISDIDSR